jgi:distribution and morphology protein 31
LKHSEADRELDYRRFRHETKPGDFQLESLQIEDFLATIYQPNDFRPYPFSVFQASIGNLRKQWLFYDLLSAESITGQVDNCLFSLHKPQSMRTTSEHDMKDNTWKRMVSRANNLDQLWEEAQPDG